MTRPHAEGPEQRQYRDLYAAALGAPLSDALASQLNSYLKLLAQWNRVYNLTSVRTEDGMLRQHLLDCLAVVAPMRRQLKGAETSGTGWLDVGSGGGLPGVVLAACLPQVRVSCVDTVAKKAAFIRQAAAELALPNLAAIHSRVEKMNSAPFHLITSRAFASLADFTRLTAHLLAPGGIWVAMKGKTPDDEIRALGSEFNVFHVEQLRVPGLDAQRCLVWIKVRA